MAATRRESFYVEKQQLVERIGRFLKKQVPLQTYSHLKTEFQQRTEKRIDKELEDSFFTYWLFFYYRFDNNLRGIEWFYTENASQLTEEERTMTEAWQAMRPRFLQAIDLNEKVVIFEDIKTGEQFPLSRDKENIEHLIPWASTLAMIESFDEVYYFNGFRSTVEPLQLHYALDQLEMYAKKDQIETEDALFAYFPEIIATLLNHDLTRADYGREVSEYTATFQIQDPSTVLDFLRNQSDFRIDKWLESGRELVWAGDWRIYHDSEYPSPLQLADVFGSIIVSDDDTLLTFQTMQQDKIALLQERFQPMGHAILKVDEAVSLIGTFQTKVHNVLVSMEDEMPAYFAIYAQNDIYQDINVPLPVFDGLTIRDLYAQGEMTTVDNWLKNAEYALYKQVLERFHEVAVTADFNKIRSDFGLPLSPFVTGGHARETSLTPIELEKTGPRLLEEDIPYLEALGFTPESIDHFYISDFVRFYKEKTIGKSDSTIRKYRKSLADLRILMTRMPATSWDECDSSHWQAVVTKKYVKMNPEYSKTERKNFLNVVRGFLSWLDHMHDTALFPETIEYLQTIE